MYKIIGKTIVFTERNNINNLSQYMNLKVYNIPTLQKMENIRLCEILIMKIRKTNKTKIFKNRFFSHNLIKNKYL